MPLHDNYFAEPLAHLFSNALGSGGGDIVIEICGILKSGRTQLHICVPSVAASALNTAPAIAVSGASRIRIHSDT